MRPSIRKSDYTDCAQAPPDADGVQRMPPMLGPYHSLCPLEEPSAEERPSQVFGMRTAMFKGISVADGAGYALRRIDGRQVCPHLPSFSQFEVSASRTAPHSVSLARAAIARAHCLPQLALPAL